MKEIIPLKKDIIFKTKIGELTNISLDHDYKINDDIIEGTVVISGTYKLTEASVQEEEFYYTIPFSVAISKRIDKDTINIEIDDFKYEPIKDVLKVNIDLLITCDEKESLESMLSKEKTIIDEGKYAKESENDDLDNYIDNYFNSEEIKKENNIKENNIKIEDNISNITNNFTNENKYYTYKVYIVRSGDTIENICNKYNITLEELKLYNNIGELNIGDKIIIPQVND
jgi:LysM repeat protein